MKAKLAGVDKMIGAHHESWWKTPAFYRADGRPVFPIGGGAPDDDEDDTDDADADDADDDGGSDLDDEIDDAVGTDDDTDDDTDLTPAEKKLAARLEKQLKEGLAAATQSIADRVVNASLTAQKKAAAKKAAAAASGGGKPTDKPAVDYGPDIRDAKATYREMVVGEITFASNVEREAGMKLASAVVTRAVQTGVDPDEAGKQAAQEVASTITAIRKDARKQLLVQLKKEGRLVQKEKPEGGGSGGGIGTQATRVATGASAKTDMQKGAEAAARIRPRAAANK